MQSVGIARFISRCLYGLVLFNSIWIWSGHFEDCLKKGVLFRKRHANRIVTFFVGNKLLREECVAICVVCLVSLESSCHNLV